MINRSRADRLIVLIVVVVAVRVGVGAGAITVRRMNGTIEA